MACFVDILLVSHYHHLAFEGVLKNEVKFKKMGFVLMYFWGFP